MKILAGGCRLFDPEDGDLAIRGNWTSISRIGKATGAKQVSQTVQSLRDGAIGQRSRIPPRKKCSMWSKGKACVISMASLIL